IRIRKEIPKPAQRVTKGFSWKQSRPPPSGSQGSSETVPMGQMAPIFDPRFEALICTGQYFESVCGHNPLIFPYNFPWFAITRSTVLALGASTRIQEWNEQATVCNPGSESEMATPTNPSERVLVAKAQAGNEEAFSELVRRHSGQVYGLSLNMLRNR